MGYFMENPKPYLNYLILYKWMIWVYPWIGNLRMFRSETHHHIWICTPIQRTQNDKSTTILQQENTQKNMVQRLVFLGGSFGVLKNWVARHGAPATPVHPRSSNFLLWRDGGDGGCIGCT